MAAVKTAAAATLLEYDIEACDGGQIAGADEVGRGCLAGPIVAAAVVFDYSLIDIDELAPVFRGLGDSKKLTAKMRERIFPLILRRASSFSIICAGSRTIDRDGLHVTNLRILARSLESLSPCPQVALVDGRQKLPDCLVEHRPVTKGDSKSACIAAASIIAKVTRDRLMTRLHDSYPDYGFNGHVGYGSAAHREAIARHGYSPLHRRSFKLNLPNIFEAEPPDPGAE